MNDWQPEIIETLQITGRGTVLLVSSDRRFDRTASTDPIDWTVTVDGKPYRVTGIERRGVGRYIEPGEKVGLVVSPATAVME